MSDWRVPGYTEIAELGRGGGGRVVAAVDESSGQRVAIKYLADRLAADEQFRTAFRTEADLLARLNVPHVTRVRRYLESDSGAAIVMDLVDGVSLRRVLAEHGAAGPKAALSVLSGSLEGLAAAHHAGIVHRDYKPENVIVRRDGTSMLVDFGIAARSGAPGRPAGTPGYAAPEQWTGLPASPSGDIYAAGVTFWECLSGDAPPAVPSGVGTGPSADLNATTRIATGEPLGARLARVIGRATSPDPAVRPAHASVLLAELRQAADERFGAGWYEEGRDDLGRAAVALLALGLGAAAGSAAGMAAAGSTPAAVSSATGSAGPAAGPAASATTTLRRGARRAGRAGRAGGVHSPAVIIGTAVAITVAAGTAVAVTLAGHHGTRNSAGPGTTPTASVAAGSPRHSPHATPTSKPSPTATAIAVNPADPCTWLTSADFARDGLHPGHLSPGSFPGGWKACRNGRYYVGIRSAFLAGCPPSLGFFTCRSVSVPGASSAQFLDIPRPPEAELHAERGGLQYSIGVPRGVAGSAVLIRLMELVLSRTAH